MKFARQGFKKRLYPFMIWVLLVHSVHAKNLCEIKDDNAIHFQLGGKCLEYTDIDMDWNSAIKFCEKRGGILAKIDIDTLTTANVLQLRKYLKLPNERGMLVRLGRSTNIPFWPDDKQGMLIRLGLRSRSTTTPFWLDGSKLLGITAPGPNACGLLQISGRTDELTYGWETKGCRLMKFPIICQYGKHRRPKVPRKRKSQSPITKQLKKSGYMVGQPLSERQCSGVTMCSRVCSTDRQCVCFNYNTLTRQCQLFDGRYHVTYADSPDWSVWSMGRCELQFE